MRITLLIALMMAAGTLVAGTTLYRWVDDQGRVHYSDQPQPQAEAVEIADPATFKSVKPQQRQAEPAAETGETLPVEETFPGYDSVRITAPKPDQVLWNLGSVLTVNISLQPSLEPGHSVQVFYNGKEVEDWPKRAFSHQIANVYRGTHTVSVSISDASGKQIATGDAVTFYVKQTSILN